MTSWKLVSAAIKAQRTWAKLTPEQKEQVRQKATQAARNTYARMQDTPQPAQPRAPATNPAPPAAAQVAAPTAPQPQPHSAPADADASQPAAAAAAEALVGLAQTHGPRLARQAAMGAMARSQGSASRLVGLWRRAQQRSSK